MSAGSVLELLPCPWCGGKAYEDAVTWTIFGARTSHNWAVGCSDCEASAPGDHTQDAAIAAWNRRHDMALKGSSMSQKPTPVTAMKLIRAAITRFDKAAQDYAFIGSQDPIERPLIEHEYKKSREDLERFIEKHLK